MKKHKGLRIMCIIGFIFLVFGGILFGAGIASGGKLQYLRVSKETTSWWPFQHGSIGFGGFDVFDDDYDYDMFSDTTTYTQDLKDVKSVQIDVDAGDVEIRRGSVNSIEYRTRKQKFIKIDDTNGNLKISIEHDGFSLHSVKESIVLQLRDELYDQIKIDSKLGDIDIEGIRAKSFDIYLALGDIDIENIYSEAFVLDQKCGDIDVAGQLLGNSKISNKLGETDVTIQGNMNDYRYRVNNTLGDTSVFGNERDGSANMEGGSMEAKHFITIDNTLGDIELDIQ